LAVRSACALARTTGAQIDIVHVVHRPHLYERVLQRHPARDEELVAKATEHLRQSTAGPGFTGVQIRHHVRLGAPFAELIAGCTELGDGLLVIGARKRSSLSDL